jgi:hypothetical protein
LLPRAGKLPTPNLISHDPDTYIAYSLDIQMTSRQDACMNNHRFSKRSMQVVQYILLILVTLTANAAGHETIREQRTVSVHGQDEVWKLVWHGKTELVCADNDTFYTCPCIGFGFGESGKLSLVREANGNSERFDLAHLFYDYPARTDRDNSAVLRRWDVHKGDLEAANDPVKYDGFMHTVSLRKLSDVMTFNDYDHDGAKSEFLLQVAAETCGKKMMALIGVSASNPKLHAFSSVDHPERALIMQSTVWDKLLAAKGEVAVTTWRCGDHGGDVENELKVSASAGHIKVRSYDYQCTDDNKRGALIKQGNL